MKVSGKAALPRGFKANGIACGIKKSGRPDLALFYSQTPAAAACLFTANSLIAAPLALDKEYLQKSGDFQAILVNSGNANALTGVAGIRDARELTAATAALLNNVGTGFKPVPTRIKKENILINSTGIIGKRLPVEKIKTALPRLVKGLSAQGIKKAQAAVMTTDTFPKAAAVSFKVGAKTVRVCGIAKGSGMIAPNMATMLVFIFTDAVISPAALKKALRQATDKSFNCISVDGCMSTNDTVMALAGGASAVKIASAQALAVFCRALEAVCGKLAELIVRDGEGSTKFIRIKVRQAAGSKEARSAALAIANSNLVKTAIYGENPNFGRIAAAVGASGVDIKEEDLLVKVSPLKKKDIDVEVSLGRGSASCTVYTTDLSPEYIKINAEYN